MKNKIAQITTYVVLGVVVIGLILCSVIKVSFRPEMSLPSLTAGDKIEISLTGTAKIESSDENINYDKFIQKFDDSFKLTILYSVFSGKMGSETKIDETKTAPSYNGFTVKFIFSELQTLKKDGKELTVANNSSTPIKYNTIAFDVVEDLGLTSTTLYFYENGKTTYYQLTSIANFDSLYSYIKDIPMFGE